MKLDQARLKELLHYDPISGVWTWRVSNTRVRAGDRAGTVVAQGYRKIKLDGKKYFEHRLAWLYVLGRWPAKGLDHKNRRKSDNRWVNLREATKAQNAANTEARRNNKSGYKGVSPCGARWTASIRVSGGSQHLGVFDTPQKAHQAYSRAARCGFGEWSLENEGARK